MKAYCQKGMINMFCTMSIRLNDVIETLLTSIFKIGFINTLGKAVIGTFNLLLSLSPPFWFYRRKGRLSRLFPTI